MPDFTSDSHDEHQRHNRHAWDRMARNEHLLARPAKREELESPLSVVDGVGWLSGNISGWKVLCLAAGGGRHGPLYASAGADVTVLDISPEMLALDSEMARQLSLPIRTVEGSMNNLAMFTKGQFDLIVHPVSTCYLSSVQRVFAEIARVLRVDGLYISQHKQPANLQASLETYTGQYVIEHAYYDSTPVRMSSQPSWLREPGTREFVHSWAALLGGICSSGMVIEDVLEPRHGDAHAPPGSFGHRCHYIAPYIRIKARRVGKPTTGSLFLS